MKLTAILLLIGCLQVSANGFAQGKITMRKSGATLEEVLVEINKQTGVLYSANGETLRKAAPIDINVKNEELGKVLSICFEGQPLTYLFKENIIIVKEKVAPVKVRVEDERTPIDVRGKVTDEKGNPVQGVTVTIKGTEKQTLTDENGEFSLSSIDKEAVLVFTSVNMEMFEVKVNGRAELSVTLKTKIREMGEVIVSTGYQSLARERATGSFSKPDNKMYNARVSTDVLSRLEGISPGVVFNRSSESNSSISIRGRSTIIANEAPLVIVDNFPYEGDIHNINPNDIEDVTILKDAAAASIWGARAGNGVIVITTRKGKMNQAMQIQVNTNVTIGGKPDLTYNRNFINSSDFIDVEQFLYNNNFYSPYINATSLRLPLSPFIELALKRKAGIISAQDSINQVSEWKSLDIRSDLKKYFFQQLVNQQYNLNISGGNEKSTYLLSAGYDRNQGSLVGNGYKRISISMANSYRPIKKLELSLNANYVNSTDYNNSTLNSLSPGGQFDPKTSIFPYARLVDDQGDHLATLKDYRYNWVDTLNSSKFADWKYRPLDELAFSDDNNKLSNIRLLGSLHYDIIPGLSADVKYQYEEQSILREVFFSENTYFARNLFNQFSATAPNPLSSSGRPGSILESINQKIIANNLRAQLTIDRKISNHAISAIAGVEAKESKANFSQNRLYGYNRENGSSLLVNYSTVYPKFPSGGGSIPNINSVNGGLNRYRSWFGNFAYTYDNRYTLSGSGRIDQTNLFGVKANQKAIPLWSVGAKWNIDKEGFYHIDAIHNLVLRATYGFNGNFLNNGTAYVTAAYNNQTSDLQPVFAVIQTTGNPQLTWEKINIFNIGIDFSAFSFLTGSFEYFSKKGENMVGSNPIPSSTGFTSVIGNFSNIKASGFDLVISSQNLRGNLSWNSSFLVSKATDKVIKFTGTIPGYNIVEGRPVQSIYALPWAGLDPSNGDPRGILADTISKDYSALLSLVSKDRVYMGAANPRIYGGLRNTIAYKNFSISFNIAFKFDYYFFRNTINYFGLYKNWSANADFYDRWQKAGDESTTNIPSMVYTNSGARDGFFSNSQAVVEKGDHIRFQDFSLSYNVLEKSATHRPFKNLTIYTYINNIGLLWRANKYNIDPDYQTGYPPVRVYALGVKCTIN